MLNTVALTLDTFRGNARSMKSFFLLFYYSPFLPHFGSMMEQMPYVQCPRVAVSAGGSTVPVNTCPQRFGGITQYITLSSCSSSTFCHVCHRKVCVIGWNHQKPHDWRSARISNLGRPQWFELCWPRQSFRSNNTSGARRLACIHKLN